MLQRRVTPTVYGSLLLYAALHMLSEARSLGGLLPFLLFFAFAFAFAIYGLKPRVIFSQPNCNFMPWLYVCYIEGRT